MRTHVYRSRFSSLPIIIIATLLLASCDGRRQSNRDDAQLQAHSGKTTPTVQQPGTGSAAADESVMLRDSSSVGGEEYSAIVENDFLDAAANRFSTFSIDVDAASYSNVRRFLTQRSLPPRDAVRIEELVNYFPYDYPEPTGADPFSITAESAACPWNPAHRLVHVGLQGRHIDMGQLPASNLTFLIDVSGSMEEPNKLPLLKSAFHLLVDQLRPQDRVAIVVYAGAAGVALEPTSGSEKGKILNAIDDLQSGGSTAGG
ncbi:MAG: von Willebrand factor type A domain-containing protein, partial [Candidatus Kapaibacterium sp.]